MSEEKVEVIVAEKISPKPIVLDNMNETNTNFIQVGELTPLPGSTVTTTAVNNWSVGRELKDVINSNDSKYEGPDHLGVFDVVIQKIISRKLLVWVIATVLLAVHVIAQDVWLTITGVYLGSQALIEVVEKLKAPTSGNTTTTTTTTPPGEGEA